MNPNWMIASVNCIAMICLVAAIAETVVDDGENGNLRLICGLAASASVIRMAAEMVQRLL